MARYLLAFIGLWLSLSSCLEKEVAYELPFEGEKIVVEGVIFSDEPLQLRLQKTFNPLAPDIKIELRGAEVELLENGRLVDRLVYQEEPGNLFRGSLYRSTAQYLPDLSSGYEIRLKADGLPPAHSLPVSFPPAPSISLIQAEIDTIVSLIRLNARLEIQNIHPENAYWIKASAWYQLAANQPDTLIDVYTIPVPGNQLQRGQLIYELEEINLIYDLPNGNDIPGRLYPKNEIIFTAIAFGPEYKNYLEDVDNFDPEIGGFFPGSAQIRSNIEGGYGVFGAASKDRVLLKL